jgi:hypothetical protein
MKNSESVAPSTLCIVTTQQKQTAIQIKIKKKLSAEKPTTLLISKYFPDFYLL